MLSLIFWALMIIVTIKYVLLHHARRQRRRGRHHGADRARAARAAAADARKLGLIALGIFGAALFYGDGMITPAISVLSAVEGLEVAVAERSSDYVVPITLVILIALFAIQRFGTGAVGGCSGR